MQSRRTGSVGGPVRRASFDDLRPCGLACVRIRSAAAAGGLQFSRCAAFFTRCRPLFRRSLALAPYPHPKAVLVGRLHILAFRRAADRFALLRCFGLTAAAIAALLARASCAPLLRPPPCGGLRAPRPRPPVSGIRSACLRSLRFAPVAGARSGASPLLPRVRPAARAAFSRRPCRSAPAAPLLRLPNLLVLKR